MIDADDDVVQLKNEDELSVRLKAAAGDESDGGEEEEEDEDMS